MSDQITKTLPSRFYGRDPLDILIEKETSVERKQRSCRGCKNVNVVEVEVGFRVICNLGKNAGTKCNSYKEIE